MNKLNKMFIKQTEESFKQPEYVDFKIRYVSDQADAEVCVTKYHTLADYLMVGIFCLAKSVREESGEIRVFNLEEEKTESVVVFDGELARDVDMNSEFFLQMCNPVDEICKALYKNAPEMTFFGFGLGMSIELMSHFSGCCNIPENIMSKMLFPHFDDTKQAEKNAFELIKAMYAATLAGYYYELTKRE